MSGSDSWLDMTQKRILELEDKPRENTQEVAQRDLKDGNYKGEIAGCPGEKQRILIIAINPCGMYDWYKPSGGQYGSTCTLCCLNNYSNKNCS